jgi:UPF0755 protein
MSKIFDQDRIGGRRNRTLPDWNDDTWDQPTDSAVADSLEFTRVAPSLRPLRWVAGLILIAMIVGVVVLGFTALGAVHQINPKGEPGEQVNITVEKGMDLDALAKRLQEAGVIEKTGTFKQYTDFKGGVAVQPGFFTIRKNESFDKIIAILQTPPELTYDKVTFPEGITLEQVAKRLHDKIPRLSAEKFLEVARSGTVKSTLAPDGTTNLEGLLFPDTYLIAANEDETKVLKRMVDLMDRIAGKERVDTKAVPYDIIKLASLIEREAKSEGDRAKISRVIWNRLNSKLKLDIDATLLYGTPGEQTQVTDEMKAADNPYNSYKFGGLPPTPIAMPSRASLHAAMVPYEGNDGAKWLYYVVADAAGNHVFANTLTEHNGNVAKARAAGLL